MDRIEGQRVVTVPSQRGPGESSRSCHSLGLAGVREAMRGSEGWGRCD
jgi:hypothetical protein